MRKRACTARCWLRKLLAVAIAACHLLNWLLQPLDHLSESLLWALLGGVLFERIQEASFLSCDSSLEQIHSSRSGAWDMRKQRVIQNEMIRFVYYGGMHRQRLKLHECCERKGCTKCQFEGWVLVEGLQDA